MPVALNNFRRLRTDFHCRVFKTGKIRCYNVRTTATRNSSRTLSFLTKLSDAGMNLKIIALLPDQIFWWQNFPKSLVWFWGNAEPVRMNGRELLWQLTYEKQLSASIFCFQDNVKRKKWTAQFKLSRAFLIPRRLKDYQINKFAIMQGKFPICLSHLCRANFQFAFCRSYRANYLFGSPLYLFTSRQKQKRGDGLWFWKVNFMWNHRFTGEMHVRRFLPETETGPFNAQNPTSQRPVGPTCL